MTTRPLYERFYERGRLVKQIALSPPNRGPTDRRRTRGAGRRVASVEDRRDATIEERELARPQGRHGEDKGNRGDCTPPLLPWEWSQLRNGSHAAGLAHRIAVHEGAHAVALYDAGAGVGDVYIRVRRTSDGTPELAGGRCNFRDGAKVTALVYLAGMAAERLDPRLLDPPEWHRKGYGGDCRCFDDLRPAYESERTMQPLAEATVRKYGAAVDALADALVAKRHLSGEEATAIIESALPYRLRRSA